MDGHIVVNGGVVAFIGVTMIATVVIVTMGVTIATVATVTRVAIPASARELVNVDLVIPVGVHVAIVAVAEGSTLEGLNARTRGLCHSGAITESGWAVILCIVVAVG